MFIITACCIKQVKVNFFYLNDGDVEGEVEADDDVDGEEGKVEVVEGGM